MSGHALRLTARLSKLRAMSLREIAHRLSYRRLLTRERRAYERGTLAPPDRLRLALVPALQSGDWKAALLESRASNGRRFLPSIGEREALKRLFQSGYVAERDDMRLKAAEARTHTFAFFGQQFRYGDEIDWQADPVTGTPWPRSSTRISACTAGMRGMATSSTCGN
jgi:hypothetical protein